MKKKLKIGILASPSLSGGNNVIFEHISHIHKRGELEVILIFDNPVKDEELFWFKGIQEVPRITLQQAEHIHFDVLIATFWRTCYGLASLNADSYLYFNQSVESKFYPDSDFNNQNAAEAAYFLELNIITEASWIQKYVKENYNTDSELVLNGIRKENYSPTGEAYAQRENGKLRVLIEGNINSSFKNVAKTIEICKKSKADEIWLLTNSPIQNYEGVDRVFSNIPTHETQKIFRSCDVLVKLSTVEGMFGPPLEMFHCGGTAITYNVTGHEEYMKHEFNSLIADMNDDTKILEYINLLKDHPQKLETLKKNALQTAGQWYNWEDASLAFEKAILKSIEKEQPTKQVIHKKIQVLNRWFTKTNELTEEVKQTDRKLGLKIHKKLASILKKFKI
ncbi:Glycosyltransferase involved in cell wall bisynthesis [Chryseobacterium oleae]|uniref:Glycosyltransferase involved in cell wall bisynthesis n=1 Tax=Chryseobacterium oleae TaxID=491207 RepID=A0A1I4ZDR4_CHROL|nr:glycosyltransferase [Chryseobacterium oleae]SFN48020.1 Glycosyltransferase involved in cell wall bisynthesis [Chryseobacterium oleae]